MPTIEDIKNLRNQYDETSNNPIAIICDYLIEQIQDKPENVDVEFISEIPNTD